LIYATFRVTRTKVETQDLASPLRILMVGSVIRDRTETFCKVESTIRSPKALSSILFYYSPLFLKDFLEVKK